ncbi:EI24 domain-containing protein [Oleisolibacter albus]|uniref:EI24 domain-containing protein n=1 Tax=Oleisolibacter albus TaxID=2171757 RepID=UPI000DF449D4|nr:EI24 domain-containing protein [Oleisolibacter albus]
MISHFSRAMAQLPDPAFRRVVWRAALGTLLLFMLLLGLTGWTLARLSLFQIGWLDTGIDLLGGAAVLILSWLMFPAVMITISSLMLDRIVEAVEARHYPGLPPPRKQSLREELWNSLKFLGLVVLLNLLALPLYFIPGVNLFLYYSLNGYLLGREYYELVAVRRLSRDSVRLLRSEESLRLFVAGVIIAFISVLPIVNLFAPVVATAFMVHLFEQLRRGLPHPGPA